MGLTVHYTLTLPGSPAAEDVEALVRTAHRRAAALVRRRRLARIGPVTDIHSAGVLGDGVVFERDGDETLCHEVPVELGWVFTVSLGDGCESACFGLCRYPARLRVGRRWLRTGLGGWNWSDFCKTQYASRHGAEHFVHCHRAVIDLVLIWERLGCTVKIKDEGDYWPGRDKRKLLASVGLMDRLLAGFGGAAKDAAEACGAVVEAPIFADPRFEHLEAEAAAAHAASIQRATQLVTSLSRPR